MGIHLMQLPDLLQCSAEWLFYERGPVQGTKGMPPDEAAVRGGLAAMARIDHAMAEVREELLKQYDELTREAGDKARAARAIAATDAIQKANAVQRGKHGSRRSRGG
jgi:hypothetical protein